jgi:hypothetical protein
LLPAGTRIYLDCSNGTIVLPYPALPMTLSVDVTTPYIFWKLISGQGLMWPPKMNKVFFSECLETRLGHNYKGQSCFCYNMQITTHGEHVSSSVSSDRRDLISVGYITRGHFRPRPVETPLCQLKQ